MKKSNYKVAIDRPRSLTAAIEALETLKQDDRWSSLYRVYFYGAASNNHGAHISPEHLNSHLTIHTHTHTHR